MTQETFLVFGLDDIAAIRFDCKCGASIALTPGNALHGPLQCQQCGEPISNDRTVYMMMTQFINGLAEAKKIKSDFQIRLVVKASASRASGAS